MPLFNFISDVSPVRENSAFAIGCAMRIYKEEAIDKVCGVKVMCCYLVALWQSRMLLSASTSYVICLQKPIIS